MTIPIAMAIGKIIASAVVAQPDFAVVWDAPAGGAPDVYEVQAATNVLQFQDVERGCHVFRGQEYWVSNNVTSLPLFLSDAPQRFFRVRAWKDLDFSDWGPVAPAFNSQTQTNN